MIFEKFPNIICFLTNSLIILSILKIINGLCIFGKQISCLTELSDEETNRTVEFVLYKYEQTHMKIMGQLEAVHGLRLTHGHKPQSESQKDDKIVKAEDKTNENVDMDMEMEMEMEMDEEEVNIHFKYVDNTPHDIIQNCVFVIYSKQWEECKRIETICNTFLPITPRPLMQRDNLRVCNDNDVELDIQSEEMDSTTVIDTTYNNEGSKDDDDDNNDEMITKPFKTVDKLTFIQMRMTN